MCILEYLTRFALSISTQPESSYIPLPAPLPAVPAQVRGQVRAVRPLALQGHPALRTVGLRQDTRGQGHRKRGIA